MAARNNTNRTLAILGAITLVAIGAIFAVTRMRTPTVPDAGATTSTSSTTTTFSPPPTTIPTTTTTLFVLPNQTGEPFDWDRTLEVADQTPIALVEHENSIYLFTATPDTRIDSVDPPTGLQTWVSGNGEDWELLDVIEDDYVVSTVISTRFGLIASGYDPTNGDGIVWRSDDGSEWEPTVVDPGLGPNHRRSVTFAVASDDLVYIAVLGYFQTDYALINRALSDYFGAEVTDYSLIMSDSDLTIQAYGPLGILLGQPTPAQLGLTDQQVSPPFSEFPDTAWISRDGSTWEIQSPQLLPQWGFVGLDGQIYGQMRRFQGIAGQDNATAVLSTSDLTWEDVGPSALGEVFDQWSGGFIGRNNQVMDQVALSSDGISWRNLSPVSQLTRDVSWQFSAMGGHEVGVAMVGSAFPETGPVQPRPVEWEQDGYTIRATEDAFTVISQGNPIATAPRWDYGDDPGVEWDPDTNTISILHPTTGATLVVMDIDEVTEILPYDGRRTGIFQHPHAGNAFMFSHGSTWETPGVVDTDRAPSVWTIQDLTPFLPGRPTHLLVLSDRVIVAASGSSGTEAVVGLIPDSP